MRLTKQHDPRTRRRPPSRARRGTQVVLLSVAVVAAGAATYRFVATRGPATPHVRLVVTPSSGPVGMHPFVELRGWPEGTSLTVRLCAVGEDRRCADLVEATAPQRVRTDPIPAAFEDGVRIAPGAHEIVAGTGEEAERVPFTVVAFSVGARPPPRAWTPDEIRVLEAGPPQHVADGVACHPSVAPDGRLLVGRTLFDPATAVVYDVAARGVELVWAPTGDRLAIVTDDRKEIRLADPDGSAAETVVREARGLLSSVTWAPDGDRLAFVARPDPGVRGGPARPTVRALSLLDGSVGDLGPGEAVAWAGDPELLAVEVAEGGGRSIYRLAADGSRSKVAEGRRPAWAPDSSMLAFVKPVGGDTGEVWTSMPDGSGQRMLVEGADVCGVSFTTDGRRLVVSSAAQEAFSLDIRALRTP